MFLNDLIQRRLAALLQPWLRGDHELQLKLGLLRSNGALSNVTFDTAALNDLLDDPSVFCFKEVTADHVSLHFAPFSSTAFTLVVSGVRVVLSLGEEEDEGGVRWRRKTVDTTEQEREKVLKDIDAEGCGLHDTIKRISGIGTRTWRKSLWNTVTRHCNLQLHNVNVLLRYPHLHDVALCSLYLKKFGVGSLGHRCFISGFMNSLSFPFEDSSFDVDFNGFEVTLNSQNHKTIIFPANNMTALVHMNDLQSVNFSFHVPALHVLFSPADISVILLLYGLLSKKNISTRSGRQLWNIVASKLSSLLPTSKVSFVKVVRSVLLWQKYITTYRSILLLVGYPSDEMMKRSASLMFHDTRYIKSVRSQWKLISELENQLACEAIAAARRIIRYKVFSSSPEEKSKFDKFHATRTSSKLCQILLLILNSMGCFLVSLMRIILLDKVVAIFFWSSVHSGVVCQNSALQKSITLKILEISISVSPDNALQSSTNVKALSDMGISYHDLLSFRFSVDIFFLRYLEKVSEISFTFATGHLNVHSLFPAKAGASSRSKEQQRVGIDIRHKIVWSEPVQIICSPESASEDETDDVARTSVPQLDCLLGQLWSKWKNVSLTSEGGNLQNMHSPWILCNMSSCLISNGISDIGVQLDCGLIVGKLNLNLDYLSIASAAVFLRCLQCGLQLNLVKRDIIWDDPAITIQDPPATYCSKFASYSSRIRIGITRMLPAKHVQVGVFIGGLHFGISLSDSHLHTHTALPSHPVTLLLVEICNIELLVLPNVEHYGRNLSGITSECDIELESIEHREPQDNSDSESGAYSCQWDTSLYAYLKVNGLKAYFDESSENKENQIIELKPTIAKLKYIRKDYYSLGSSAIAVSAVSHWITAGFSCLMFLDELYFLTKVIFGVIYESRALVKNLSGREAASGREIVNDESEHRQTFAVRSNQGSLVTYPQIFVKGKLELSSVDMVFHKFRKSCSSESSINTILTDRETSRRSGINDISHNGIFISIEQFVMECNYKGQDVDLNIDTTGFRCIIFRYLAEFHSTSNKSELKNILGFLEFLTEASVYHNKFQINLRDLEKALPSASLCRTATESSSHGTESLHNHWLFIKIVSSQIYMAGCQMKDILIHDFEQFNAAFSVGGEFQEISCECKGGSILLEAEAVTLFNECFTLYYQWVSKLRPSGKNVVAQDINKMAPIIGEPCVSCPQVQRQEAKWNGLDALWMSLLHLSFIIVERHESGRIQELILEVDFHIRLKLSNAVRKISVRDSKFSLLSQFRDEHLGHHLKVIQSPFSSRVPDDAVPSFVKKDSSTSTQHKDMIHPNLDDRTPSTSVPIRSPHVDITNPQKYILKDLQCYLAVERPMTRHHTNPPFPNEFWVGSGYISRFDVTISLHEINMMLSAFESFSNALGRGGTSNGDSGNWSHNQELVGNIEETVPDGTIVAIQDLDEHMYITVRGAESGYDICGEVHYSLVGKRALFRVSYQKPRRWRAPTQYFSLISLYAKDNSGEPLRLSFQPRSRFVDICSNGSGYTLWKMLPFKPDAYEDAIGLESSTSLSKGAFHLLNKKNDCAVAFIDGMLEFVSKPGNLFKWKVFQDPGPVHNNLLPNRLTIDGLSSASPVSNEQQGSTDIGTDRQSDSNVTDMSALRTDGDLLGITFNMEKATLTIVHELSETEEKFPLLQGCVMPNQTIVHVSNVKVRIMNNCEFTLYYFDGQKNSWKEFIQPLNILSFYSRKSLVQGDENPLHGVPSHFYVRFKEVTVLLSELSLDIVLFVVGKLNLAGPYTVKSSLVLANCCKVENQSGLTLICQFYDSQDASISSRQSATIFLRHLSLANQPPEASFFSLQLVQKNLSTSPLHLSLLEARKFAWRTRVMSSQGSKSFPGPFIVVEISKGSEDGLSIIISPLLMIHNGTDFSLELRFQRAQSEETGSASLILKAGDVVDDTMIAFTAVGMPGRSKKALTSVNVGNYKFSFRPHSEDGSDDFKKSLIEWSDDLKGGKPIRLSGLFDKLSYQVRKAFAVNSTKYSLSSANCALTSEEGFVSNMYFLIQTVGKAVPVVNPDNFGYAPGNRNSPVAMQEQKEIYILPTIKVSNLLHTEIHVRLSDKDPTSTMDDDNTWRQATISCESTASFYSNPDTIYFVVTLTSFESSCKPVNSRDWVRKLQKKKGDIPHLDIELDFGGGKYFAMLRLSRGLRGTLEVGIFAPYALQNDTDEPLFCFSANQKSLSRVDMERLGSSIPPDLGSYLPPHSIRPWFSKCYKLHFKLLEEKVLAAQLDLDVLSGLTEIDLESEEEVFGSKNIVRLAVSLRPSVNKDSQIVSLNSRYVVCNESEDVIAIRQCYMEDMKDFTINSKERIALRLETVTRRYKATSIVDNILKKHKSQNESSFFIQFRPNETGLCWSGPICVASLGRFFVKFRRSVEFPETQSDNMPSKDNLGDFAAVHVVEEASKIVMHFHRPPVTNLPYRIENYLPETPLTYYQKGSSEPEILGAGSTVNYVWDDLTLPHKLVVQLDDVHLLREINLDKVRSWKSFYRSKQTRGLGLHLPLEKKHEDHKQITRSRSIGLESAKVGFEVYAEGTTRVLRICEFSDSHKVNMVSRSSRKMRLRISYFSVQLLEHAKQEADQGDTPSYAPILITRLERINWDARMTNQLKSSLIRVQSLSVDVKWARAPFTAMLRRHQLEKYDTNDCILHIAILLLPTIYNVKQVKYLSIVLQPLDLNLDEDTLMRIVPFWRKSLSNSSIRRQYYFDHFEIHPIKIVASFLPGDLRYSYSSTQETLRTLLHSVIKIPTIKRKNVELNGVLVTHALITLRELTIKCAQHYSWYSMRAIYIAKGSPLLPPAFASIFDDLASSSLDVFFDPSSGLINFPGVTLGTLKLISKFIDNKGFSGTKRYFGDLGKTLQTAGSNVLFAAVTEISDSILKGAETSGFNGMVNGFHQGILKLAMEPFVLGSAFMEGGPDRKIKLDRSPGVDELYIEGYLQAMLDTMYKQEYLRVRVIENEVILKNLPPSSSLIDEIMERVKGFLASKSLLKGESSTTYPLQHIRREREWKLGPTILTLCEHLFVSFMIRVLRKQSGKVIGRIKWRQEEADGERVAPESSDEQQKVKLIWKWGLGKFVLSGIVAYIDGRLCRNIPHPLARRIVSGFLLSFLDQSDDETK